MKYKIVTGFLNPYGKNVDNIVKKIQGSLDAGFKLHGNLIHVKDNQYSQAMTYKDKNENN